MLIKRLFPQKSFKQFYKNRDKVLLIRHARGMGDILTCRMLFEDFKKTIPGIKLVFACPLEYHALLRGHPYLDEIIDSATMNKNEFNISYNISKCCIKWESKHFPMAGKNRADIWAEHCGIKLQSHNMHLPFLSKDELDCGVSMVQKARNRTPKLFTPKNPNVLFTPISFEKPRTLLPKHIEGVVRHLRQMDCFVYSTHSDRIPIFEDLGVPVFHDYKIPQWLSLIHAADYVISADTSTFHYAGGIGKPLTGIFTHVDGKYRGKYYDFFLVQKHRDDGNWPCGPCYNYARCSHPCRQGLVSDPKPCLTQLTNEEIFEHTHKSGPPYITEVTYGGPVCDMLTSELSAPTGR